MTSVPDLRGDIAAFDHAISVISGEISGFAGELAGLKSHFGELPSSWTSPSAATAGQLQDAVAKRCDTLHSLLGEVLLRVQKTRQNYQHVLDTNAAMLGGGGV